MVRAGLFFILSIISVAVLAILPTGSDESIVAVSQTPVLYTNDFTQPIGLPTPYGTLVHIDPCAWGFIVGVSGLYLQHSHSGSDLDYAQEQASDIDLPNIAIQIKNIDPEYNWNWGVNAGVIFPNGSDLSADYINFNDEEKRTLLSPIFFISTIPAGGGVQFVRSEADFYLQQLDVTFGQLIHIGNRFNLHPKAGVRYGETERKLNSAFINPPGTISLEFFFPHQDSNFDGIGPLVGADLAYYLADGISLVGHFNSALLIGNQKSQLDFILGTNPPELPGADVVTEFAGKNESHNYLVPVVDGKLGLNYTYPFNNNLLSSLSFEAGYQVINYFNATSKLSFFTQLSGPTLVSNRTYNFQVNGLYLNLSVKI